MESVKPRFEPTPPGHAGATYGLPTDAPLRSAACPECPWRKQMVAGYSTAMPSDKGMMAVATDLHDRVRQGCHMVVSERCRGAEIFRANIQLDSEATPNGRFVGSIEEANAVWESRGYHGTKWTGTPEEIAACNEFLDYLTLDGSEMSRNY